MIIRLPFIDRIKVLSREIIGRDNLVLNRPRSYEVEISPSPGLRVTNHGPTVVALLASGKVDRLWSISQVSGRAVEHTRSNLG